MGFCNKCDNEGRARSKRGQGTASGLNEFLQGQNDQNQAHFGNKSSPTWQ